MAAARTIVLFGCVCALSSSCGLTHDTDGLSEHYGEDGGESGSSGSATGGKGGTSATGGAGGAGGVGGTGGTGGTSGGATGGIGGTTGSGGVSGGASCGKAGEPCCTGGTCETSAAVPVACNPSTNVCDVCGGNDAVCCQQGGCDPGHDCVGGFCRCGGRDEPCCAGAECDDPASLVCHTDGRCRCGDTGQPCCAGVDPACFGNSGKAECCTGCSGNQCSCGSGAVPGGQCKICCVVCVGPYHKQIPEDTASNGYNCAQTAQQWCQQNRSSDANQTQTGWKLPDAQGNCPGT